ncbi:MAG: UDP-N-acetylmuramate dehydrogenase [Anaerolineae bacterium]|nr:UDP-N-acetylmuramate dehydrogenase [Anaerolineae bacterium]
MNQTTHWAGELGARVLTNEPLAPHTTFRIGGPADFFITVQTVDELVAIVQRARQAQIPLFVLGNGSNILVSDRGFRGLVIENRCAQFAFTEIDATRARLAVESGAMLPGLANRLARQGWSGLEWAIGVPGTIGGAIVGNAGAHGACIADNVMRVTILDARGAMRELHKTELAFAYRTSRFKHVRDEIVLRAELELRRDDPSACIARMQQYTEHRRRTQPTEPSVGSMFKNPPGDAAGRLIDAVGLKGTRVGGVEVSSVHANFFVNRGGATASDVLRLVEIVRERVRAQFGVELELEIELVGD